MTISRGLTRYTNNPTTTLNGGIDNVVTTIVVTSALGFPNPGPYRVLIDNEIIQIGGGYGTTSWTNCIRGAEGTSAASHSNLAPVTLIATAFEFNSFRQEFNVIAYGAKGDGTSDDTTAIQNAINDAHALTGGGVVFFPSLAYNVASGLTAYSNVLFVTYGATFSGAGASSVTPLIKWGLTGTLTVPGLTSSGSVTITTGGLTISAGGINFSGGGTINGNLTLAPVQSSGQTGLTLAGVAVGSVTAETIGLLDQAQTLTITGAYSTQRFNLIQQHTITSSSPLTIGTAASLAIAGAPIAGGSTTITNSYALLIQAGGMSVAGGLNLAYTSSNTVPITASAPGVQIWIQAGDPGGSANNGDIWFQG